MEVPTVEVLRGFLVVVAANWHDLSLERTSRLWCAAGGRCQAAVPRKQ